MDLQVELTDPAKVIGVENSDDDDPPQLSATALAALQEFYSEQSALQELLASNSEGESEEKALFKTEMGKSFPEDWQLSQFWYDDFTSETLAKEVLKQAGSGTVACVSCPSIFRACDNSPQVTLFEYDKRFIAFGSSFHFYDYNHPHNVPEECLGSFSVVIADPPFLSEECLEKVAITVKKLLKEDGKVLLCTGAVMEPVAKRVLDLKPSSFVPRHKHNLGNEFACFTNYCLEIDENCGKS